MSDPLRVFIGSGEASRLERQVLIHSIRKHARRDVRVYVFNGTHNTVEPPDGDPFPAPMSLAVKYTNVTEFSNYRFLIPELCGHQGKAVWLDSDMVALADVGELFDLPMDDSDFLAKPDAYGNGGDTRWGLSVCVFDCGRTRFDLERYVREMADGLYTFTDLHQMTAAFLKHHPFRIGPLDPNWNVFDRHDSNTKLIHYTNLLTQPWKVPDHPFGELWFQSFTEARAAGAVTDRDIELSTLRGVARPSLAAGNSPGGPLGRLLRRLAGG